MRAAVESGMTRGEVERISGAGGGCAYLTYAVGDVRYDSSQYRQANGLWTAAQYDCSVDGGLHGREIRRFKKWNLRGKLCDSGRLGQSPAATTSPSGS